MGGAIFEPETDMHSHSGRLKWLPGGRPSGRWAVHQGTKPAGAHVPANPKEIAALTRVGRFALAEAAQPTAGWADTTA